MRQLTPPTNLLIALLCAAGLAASLGLPWFAVADPAARGSDGIEGVGETIVSWFGSTGPTVTGVDALATAEAVILGLAGLTALLALAMAIPGLRSAVGELLRIFSLGAPVVVAVQMISPPGSLEIRWGSFAALAVALLMANASFHGAELRERRRSRRRRPRRQAAPAAAPPPSAPAGSMPPPGA